MTEQETLKVVIDPSGVQAGANSIDVAIQRISNSWVGMSAKVFAAEMAFERAWRAAKQGAEFEESMARLNRQMAGYHSNAQLMINDLKATSSGQLSMANSAQLASRALAQGLDPSQIRTFTQAADLLGDVMGTDLKTAFDQILQGLATGRTQMLANIGVHLDLEKEVKNLAIATNRTTDQISKQERAAIGAKAVIQQLGGTLDKFSTDAISDADKMAKVEAKFDDLKLSAERFAKTLVVDVLDALDQFDKKAKSIDMQPDFFKRLFGEDRSGSLRKGFAIGPGGIALPPSETPQNMDVWQEILGRSIVADTQGNLARQAADEAKRRRAAATVPMDPKLRALQVEGSAERMRAQIEADRDRNISGFQHQSRLLAFDQQQGQQGPGAGVGALDFMKAQHDAKLREIAVQAEAQNKLLQMETETYHARIALGFETTEAKIQAEENFKTRVASINADVAKSVQEFSNASREQAAEQAVLRGRIQEELGRQITDGLISTFKVEEDLRHKSQDDAITYYTNLAKFQDAYGTSRENRLKTEYDLVRATLAKELDITFETSEKVLNAWRNGDSIRAAELIEGTQKTWDQVTSIMMEALAKQRAVSEKYSDDFFGGFAKSMHRYIQDDSMFGLGADQARSVAQAMQQSFRTHFFDALEGRIQSFKDVVQSLTDFAKNIMADVSSKIITRSILGGIDSLMSGGSIGGLVGGAGNVGGFALRGYALGGITSGPSIAGEAGPEAIVPLPNGRSIPVEWTGGPYNMPAQPSTHRPSTNVNVQVVNNAGADVEVNKGPMNADGTQDIEILINNTVKKGMRNGVFDQSMKQFGANRTPVRR
ncbi:hypothetical protein FBQ96_05095 [Nitrospirales bacterium NOB]|nr:hypothetical protein [Nitrospirales bacterium NOB]